jgi:hypothetical protein
MALIGCSPHDVFEIRVTDGSTDCPLGSGDRDSTPAPNAHERDRPVIASPGILEHPMCGNPASSG